MKWWRKRSWNRTNSRGNRFAPKPWTKDNLCIWLMMFTVPDMARVVPAKYYNHDWHIDMTTAPLDNRQKIFIDKLFSNGMARP